MSQFTKASYPTFTFLLIAASIVCNGCSRGPAAIQPVAINASSASSQAMEMYDKDGDGALNDTELAAVPGIKKYKEKYDLDGDGMVSRDEIYDRIRLWEEQKMGIATLNVELTLGGKPLEGALVSFVPEAYLGDGPKAASGTTNSSGFAKISVALEDLPEDLKTARIHGIYGGTYKISVTHSKIKVPARYNAETTLGEEIARDTLGDRLVLQLEKE